MVALHQMTVRSDFRVRRRHANPREAVSPLAQKSKAGLGSHSSLGSRLRSHETETCPEIAGFSGRSPQCPDCGQRDQSYARSVRHTDAPSGLPRVLSWLGRLSCRNTGSQLNGRHPQPVNAYHATRNIDDNDMCIYINE